MVKRYRAGLISATDYNQNGFTAGSMFSMSDRSQLQAANVVGFIRPMTYSDVSYLVVAGGGGAARYGGGGGAGGLLANAMSSAGTYTVIIGAGGTGVSSGHTSGSNTEMYLSPLGPRSPQGLLVVGGGKGALYGSPVGDPASPGGSGGGAGMNNGGMTTAGTGVTGQGYPGGAGNSGWSGDERGGGGGGAGQAGANGGTGVGGNGGNGISWINGEFFAGGGGGANGQPTGVPGGRGGGGTGYPSPAPPDVNGVANTGGGGGSTKDAPIMGSGGSGVVIIAHPSVFPSSTIATTGTKTTSTVGGNVYHKFTGPGTFTIY